MRSLPQAARALVCFTVLRSASSSIARGQSAGAGGSVRHPRCETAALPDIRVEVHRFDTSG